METRFISLIVALSIIVVSLIIIISRYLLTKNKKND